MSNSLGLLNSNDKAKLDNIINIKFSNVLQELTPNKSYDIYDNKAYNKLIEIANDENNVKYTTIILHIPYLLENSYLKFIVTYIQITGKPRIQLDGVIILNNKTYSWSISTQEDNDEKIELSIHENNISYNDIIKPVLMETSDHTGIEIVSPPSDIIILDLPKDKHITYLEFLIHTQSVLSNAIHKCCKVTVVANGSNPAKIYAMPCDYMNIIIDVYSNTKGEITYISIEYRDDYQATIEITSLCQYEIIPRLHNGSESNTGSVRSSLTLN